MSQRRFTKSLGKVNLNNTTSKETTTTDLGSPNFRTIWEIVQAVVEFEIELEGEVPKGEEWTLQITINLFVAGDLVAFYLIEKKFKSEISHPTIPFAQYYLEPTLAPPNVSKALPVELQISYKFNPQHFAAINLNKTSISLAVNQEYAGKRKIQTT